MENKGLLAGFIVVAVTLLVGIILAMGLGDSLYASQNTFTVLNDTTSVASLRGTGGNFTYALTKWVDLDYKGIRKINGAWFINGTKNITLTENTDYYVDKEAGRLYMYNTAKTYINETKLSNMTQLSYTQGENYVDDSTSRTIVSFILLFFVIGLAVWAVIWALKSFTGWFD